VRRAMLVTARVLMDSGGRLRRLGLDHRLRESRSVVAKRKAEDSRLACVTRVALALPEAALQVHGSHAAFLPSEVREENRSGFFNGRNRKFATDAGVLFKELVEGFAAFQVVD
jgi:hypothetical protein